MSEIVTKNTKADCFYTNDLGENQISYLDIIPANEKFWETLKISHKSMYEIFDHIKGFMASNSGTERGFSQYAAVS